MKKLANKVAVITGGNSGIGLATATLFNAQGAKVAIMGRDQSSIDDAVSQIGNEAVGIACHVENINAVDMAYKEINGKLGKFDILIVNAGIYITAPLIEFTEELFDQTIAVNLKGAFFSVQRALPYLNDGASIILTGSTVSEKGMPTLSVYAATKAAVRSLARSFSGELLDRNIRVNVLSPGPTDTPVYKRGGVPDETVNAIKEYVAGINPSKRLAQPEEMAQGFLFLASDDSKFMVASELLIDGGLRSL